jgi:AraC-like DNA-binding protein
VAADLVPIASSMLERLAGLGVDIARLLRDANIPRSRFETSKALLTTSEFFTFWRVLEAASGVPDLGLRIGGDAQPHQYNVASMAALHSPTLGEGLKKLARYKRLVCPEQVTIDLVGKAARIRFEWLLAGEDPPRLLVDGIYASVVALARRGPGTANVPLRLELARRRADEAMLHRYFQCDIRFDAGADVLVLDRSALAEPFKTHNAELLELIVPGLEAALNEGSGERSLADDVRTTVSQRICGERPAVDKVARALGMSPRTLQRRLEELGTTYQEILDDVRWRSARRLLANTDLDAGEVAFLLGFEELNSFTRAFHGWEGTTPTRWRTASRGNHGADVAHGGLSMTKEIQS